MFRPGLDAPASLSRATVTLSESLVLLPDSTSFSHKSYSKSLSFCRPCADLAPADSAWTVPISRISARGAPPKTADLPPQALSSPTILVTPRVHAQIDT
jgi:hypothetical protein